MAKTHLQTHSPNRGTINNLQALRAFAVLNVVFLHALQIGASYGQGTDVFAFLDGWGNNGVDIFFVISGFFMVYIQRLRPRSPQAFFAARIMRIVPIYWLLTIGLMAVTLVMPQIFRELDFSMSHGVLSLLFLTNLVSSGDPMLEVGWTLEYEMLFYALFAFALVFKNQILSIVLPAIALIALSFSGIADWIVIEFIFGMGLAHLYLSKAPIFLPKILFALGTCLLLLSIPFGRELPLHRVFISGIPAVFIVYGALYMPQIKNGLLALLGNASYSVYLAHFYIITICFKIAAMLELTVNTDVLFLGVFVASIASGLVFYYLIEKPIGRYIKSARKPHEVLVPVSH
ncbi:MAG: acyltransferase [Rhizobiales bacterium]|nr:acyltransferase [Hyphomicrobiales bacterium]